jgi:hypothetical protein
LPKTGLDFAGPFEIKVGRAQRRSLTRTVVDVSLITLTSNHFLLLGSLRGAVEPGPLSVKKRWIEIHNCLFLLYGHAGRYNTPAKKLDLLINYINVTNPN